MDLNGFWTCIRHSDYLFKSIWIFGYYWTLSMDNSPNRTLILNNFFVLNLKSIYTILVVYTIKNKIFWIFYSDWIHRIPHIERLYWNLGRSMEVQTHQNHELENISTKTYYIFTAPPLTHPPYSRSNVQSRFLSLCVKFVRRPEPPLPSASCHRQPSLLCMQASSTITGNTCICFLRPGADCWRPTCRNNVFWVGRRQCHAVDGIQTQDLLSCTTFFINSPTQHLWLCERYFPFKRTRRIL